MVRKRSRLLSEWCRRKIETLLLLTLAVGATLASPAQPAAAGNAFRSIASTPERLTVGSPFLLTLHLGVNASSVKGSWMGKEVEFFRSGAPPAAELWYALLGVDVGTEAGTYPLRIDIEILGGGKAETTRQLAVIAANYRTSALQVPGNFVEPDAATQKQIAADKELKDRVFARSAPLPEWSGDFVKPVPSAATDSFGTRRTFNGKLASIHRGMDFHAAPGTPVRAANSGTVVIARRLFNEGNCVVIDHGQGLMTLYMHFSKIKISEGAAVRKGQRLGLSGATGRVTGPHLHFAVRWRDAYLDPAGLFRLPLPGRP